MTEPAAFDPLLAIRTLARHRVRFILIGGMASRIWGSPTVTNDLDLCYAGDLENLRNLAAALIELRADLRGAPPGLPFQMDAKTLQMGDTFTLNTTAGALDVAKTPAGTSGYDDLDRSATTFDLGEGLSVRVSSLDDLMRMKRTAGRRKDLIELEVLEALKDEIKQRS